MNRDRSLLAYAGGFDVVVLTVLLGPLLVPSNVAVGAAILTGWATTRVLRRVL